MSVSLEAIAFIRTLHFCAFWQQSTADRLEGEFASRRVDPKLSGCESLRFEARLGSSSDGGRAVLSHVARGAAVRAAHIAAAGLPASHYCESAADAQRALLSGAISSGERVAALPHRWRAGRQRRPPDPTVHLAARVRAPQVLVFRCEFSHSTQHSTAEDHCTEHMAFTCAQTGSESQCSLCERQQQSFLVVAGEPRAELEKRPAARTRSAGYAAPISQLYVPADSNSDSRSRLDARLDV